YTGTCLRPSYTAIVWPMNDGKIVERRDQVLITCFFSLFPAASTFFIRCSSTKGPFFKLRLMVKPPFGSSLVFLLYFSNYFLRPRTISLLDLAFLLRVFIPSAGLPHGVIGDFKPIGDLPSPP